MARSISKNLVSAEKFKESIQVLPLVSIDLCLLSGSSILLGKRNNKPAKDWWFTPGGRILKGEPLAAAINRISNDELGLCSKVLLGNGVLLMGAWDHFYDNSAFDDSISTHYVNLPHYCIIKPTHLNNLNLPAGKFKQHSEWRWQRLETVIKDRNVHSYVRKYASWLIKNLGASFNLTNKETGGR